MTLIIHDHALTDFLRVAQRTFSRSRVEPPMNY
jgi:hypothetical protein